MRAILNDAAQCELDGPRMTGPITSLKMLGKLGIDLLTGAHASRLQTPDTAWSTLHRNDTKLTATLPEAGASRGQARRVRSSRPLRGIGKIKDYSPTIAPSSDAGAVSCSRPR